MTSFSAPFSPSHRRSKLDLGFQGRSRRSEWVVSSCRICSTWSISNVSRVTPLLWADLRSCMSPRACYHWAATSRGLWSSFPELYRSQDLAWVTFLAWIYYPPKWRLCPDMNDTPLPVCLPASWGLLTNRKQAVAKKWGRLVWFPPPSCVEVIWLLL